MSRRLSREMTLQTLFQLEFSDIAWQQALDAVVEENEKDLKTKTKEYIQNLILGIGGHKEKIDELISAHAKEWDISRIAAVDLNILRISLYEMCFAENKIAPSIVINEAVEIAKVYGGDDSPRFINGILGKIVKVTKEE